jgi:Cu-Zn family superoxide dismutase
MLTRFSRSAALSKTSRLLDDAATGIKGRALMVHAKADDYATQPSGGAGDRLACGVIE